MIQRQPRPTRIDTLSPYPTLFLSSSGDLIEQDKEFFYNPDNDVYFDRQKGHGLRGQIRLKRGPVDAIIIAETQRLTTPSIHYQIFIPAGTPEIGRAHV